MSLLLRSSSQIVRQRREISECVIFVVVWESQLIPLWLSHKSKSSASDIGARISFEGGAVVFKSIFHTYSISASGVIQCNICRVKQ